MFLLWELVSGHGGMKTTNRQMVLYALGDLLITRLVSLLKHFYNIHIEERRNRMDTRMITVLYERLSRDDDLEGESEKQG